MQEHFPGREHLPLALRDSLERCLSKEDRFPPIKNGKSIQLLKYRILDCLSPP
jgi:hypothetical protein